MRKSYFRFKVYLAGWWKDTEYRKITKKEFGKYFDLIDPMDVSFNEIRKYIGPDMEDTFIVKNDKRKIDNCDILVAKFDFLPQGEISLGTPMEVAYAFSKGIPVYIISKDDYIRNNPWLKFHSKKQFSTITACFNFLKRLN